MATYEVDVTQFVYATVTIEAESPEDAVEACYAPRVLRGISPEQVYIDPNGWVPLPDYPDEHRSMARDARLDAFVTRVKG